MARSGAPLLLIAVVGTNTFEMCENYFSIELVAVYRCVSEHSVRDLAVVVASELGSASRALLFVEHDDTLSRPACAAQFMCLSMSRPPVRTNRVTSSAANARKMMLSTVV